MSSVENGARGLLLYYYLEPNLNNFGDTLSLKIVERMVGEQVDVYRKLVHKKTKKLLAIGSIFYFAVDGDVIWGSGINGKTVKKTDYSFKELDVRAVRGPLTRQFLKENFDIDAPEIYGDPALLFPRLFPEFKRKENPSYDYIIIPHYRELAMFPKELYPQAVYPTDPWEEVIDKILDSKFVISSSLHGLIIADAYGIPSRMLRVTEKEFLFKYQDYYLGTNRPYFRFATSVEEALLMGGEMPFECDLEKLYNAFPFEFWDTPLTSEACEMEERI
ncbi:MAG: hypothetical protein A3E80_04945 [Chlamydiae bacterium RIFCSPHIGHO2_12_FULL_49_9]|nr:MAG: hypothetical protein A3E80_04945 [Chlamydiae bacterium RIFCSPHIGHO2_12_FULL_49_9]